MTKIINALRNNNEKINKFVPLFLGIYFFFICTPYIFARIPALDNIVSNSTIAYVLRFLYLFWYAGFAFILMFSNRIRVNWKWLVGCIFIYLIFVLSCFITPNTVVSYSFYFTGKVSISTVSTGVYDCLIHLARFGGDLLFFYFLVTVYPYCFKNRNQFSLIVLVAAAIALIACFYSFVFERSTMKAILDGTGNPENMKSIFHSKNEYGIFLFSGAMAVTFVFFSDTRKWMKFFEITLPLFAVMAYICGCKLAAVCIVVLIIFSYFYAIIRYFNTRRWFSVSLITIVSLLALFTIFFFSIPQLHSSGFLADLYNGIIDAFQNFSLNSLFGRVNEWGVVGRFVTGGYTLTGFFPATGYNYITSYTSINASATITVYDLHNAYVDFYAYHGIIGIAFLCSIYLFLFYKFGQLWKKNKSIMFLLLGLFICSILYGMAETYTLFVSMSANTFALNLIFLGVAIFETKEMGNKTFFSNVFSHFKKKEAVVNE